MTAISLVMIVKDESDNLAACLSAASRVADELIVVDTGSSDNTIEIAKQYSAKIGNFKWVDDFSAARNESIRLASNEWCLSIDADNVIQKPKQARKKLLNFISNHSKHCLGTVKIESQSGSADDSIVATENATKLFNKSVFKYEGIIHEQLVSSNPDNKVFSESTGVLYQHYGYLQGTEDEDHKARRNIPLLEKAIQENPQDEYYLYQLGQAHFSIKNNQEAIAAFEMAETSINFDKSKPQGIKGTVSREVLTGLLTSLCYAYINENDTNKALNLMSKHIDLNHPGVDSADFVHAFAYLYFVLGEIDNAIAAYELSLQQGKDKEDILGTGSFSSCYHIGLLYEAKSNPVKALEYYAAALEMNPAYPRVLERCIGFIVEYNTALPKEFFNLSTPELWQPVIISQLNKYASENNSDAVSLILNAAKLISSDLEKACKDVVG